MGRWRVMAQREYQSRGGHESRRDEYRVSAHHQALSLDSMRFQGAHRSRAPHAASIPKRASASGVASPAPCVEPRWPPPVLGNCSGAGCVGVGDGCVWAVADGAVFTTPAVIAVGVAGAAVAVAAVVGLVGTGVAVASPPPPPPPPGVGDGAAGGDATAVGLTLPWGLDTPAFMAVGVAVAPGVAAVTAAVVVALGATGTVGDALTRRMTPAGTPVAVAVGASGVPVLVAGTAVAVFVEVAVFVGVLVAVGVLVDVAVLVAVLVAVDVLVAVPAGLVGVTVGLSRSPEVWHGLLSVIRA